VLPDYHLDIQINVNLFFTLKEIPFRVIIIKEE